MSPIAYLSTSPSLADTLVALAEIGSEHEVLEPSAGSGNIARALRAVVPRWRITLVEIQPDLCRKLEGDGFDPIEGDFLTLDLPTFDRIVMSPPFELHQDIAHVTRAYGLLKAGGRLVSVMADGVSTRATRAYVEFRALLENLDARIVRNDPDAFVWSGSAVPTVTVTLDRRSEP